MRVNHLFRSPCCLDRKSNQTIRSITPNPKAAFDTFSTAINELTKRAIWSDTSILESIKKVERHHAIVYAPLS